ncbi:hypothetical protein L1987_88046 [Smallanthus sonchifolius]|nr:hypothetical protein L1987_88046 [Smallanthus sonchifolius]
MSHPSSCQEFSPNSMLLTLQHDISLIEQLLYPTPLLCFTPYLFTCLVSRFPFFHSKPYSSSSNNRRHHQIFCCNRLIFKGCSKPLEVLSQPRLLLIFFKVFSKPPLLTIVKIKASVDCLI